MALPDWLIDLGYPKKIGPDDNEIIDWIDITNSTKEFVSVGDTMNWGANEICVHHDRTWTSPDDAYMHKPLADWKKFQRIL